MTKIKVFCVTKNEYDLIEHFIIYYGYLFGYNNVIIIDNNSTDENVIEVYKKYIPLGINVFYEPNYEYNGQADAFNKYMNLEKSKCDFLIGLDTDEFLFSCENFKNGSDPFCKNKILDIFNSYKLDDTLFKIDLYPCSIVDKSNINYINNKFINPAIEMVYFSDFVPISNNSDIYWKDIPKLFVRSNAFISTSVGNHHISTSYGNLIGSSLGLLHFNDTGKFRLYERCRTVIDGYKYFSTSLPLKDQINILASNSYIYGFHKVRIYYIILLRMFIFDLFITYIKRIPSQEELEYHTNNSINIMTFDIENNFKNCDEAILNINKIFFSNDINKDDIIFYDEPLDKLSIKYKICKMTHLQVLLKKLTTTTT